MDILNVTTTKNALSTTANATYNIEYSISDNKITKIIAAIYALKTEVSPEEIYIGQILFENDNTTASFTGKISGSKLFADYETILAEIEKDAKSK
ncbi:hypothetical protein [Dysgonomonas sp. 511]|uniref:hypothetical protein n=1 Tax=Dysgonomonas sp. 511 TaxID=2302930 RepID=UPI0013D30D61|nr:hypothetical protein [Dysgonomonas sp. 511]NDV80049.1 hypothetical protein [Dysgonomonas sp. 511]